MHSAQHNDALESTSRLSQAAEAVLSDLPGSETFDASISCEDTAYVELDLMVPTSQSRDDAAALLDTGDSDPATQALELATTRAELNRLKRSDEELQRAVRLRDGWLHGLRAELQAAENTRARTQAQLDEAHAQIRELGELVASLKIDLDALRAAEPTSGEFVTPMEFDPEHPPCLQPLGHDGPTVVLDRKVITVGRTTESDMCVPSPLVSRDHARLLVSANAVTLVDVGSVNGCFVNQRQVKKEVLREGDVLRIADYAFRLTMQS